MTGSLFPTTVIGSLPRKAWVRDLILDRKSGLVSEEQANERLDHEIDSIIRLQENAGLDEITDGEWRRESYVKVFAERVGGFEPDINPAPAGLESRGRSDAPAHRVELKPVQRQLQRVTPPGAPKIAEIRKPSQAYSESCSRTRGSIGR